MKAIQIQIKLNRQLQIQTMGASQSNRNQQVKPSSNEAKSQVVAPHKSKNQLQSEQRMKAVAQNLYFATDQNGLNMFHRAALSFAVEIFEEAKAFYPEAKAEEHARWASDAESSCGVSPLAFAVINYKTEFLEKRKSFIQYIVRDLNCEVDTANHKTFWTPLHWAARHGDLDTIKLLITRKCTVSMPSREAIYPIDMAGFFNHQKCLKALIEYSIECFDQLKGSLTQKQLATDFILGEVVMPQSLFFHADKFLVSPMYATKLLYWACRCPEISPDQVQKILETMEAYPEGVVCYEYENKWFQTPFHGAALSGCDEKLHIICSEYQQRHKLNREKNSAPDSQASLVKKQKGCCHSAFSKEPVFIRRNTEVKTVCSQYDEMLEKLKKLSGIKRVQKEFWQHLKSLHKADFTIDIPDFQYNTPLHCACTANSSACCYDLCMMWNCSLNSRNLLGHMPKQMAERFPDIAETIEECDYQVERRAQKILDKIENDETQAKSSIIDSFTGKNSTKIKSPDDLESRLQIMATPRLNQVAPRRQITNAESKKLMDLVGLNQKQGFWPKTPNVIMRFRVRSEAQRMNLDFVIKNCIADSFTVDCFSSVYADEYIVCLNLGREQLLEEATRTQFLIKLQDFNIKVAYNNKYQQWLQPFLSRQKQMLIKNRLTRLFKDSDLSAKGSLSVQSRAHTNERAELAATFKRKVWRQLIPFQHYIFSERYPNEKQMDLIMMDNYFGEFTTVQHAKKIHHTKWMLVAMLFALAVSIYQFVNSEWLAESGELHVPNSRLCTAYTLFMVVWVVLKNEGWKRKENQLKCQLGDSNSIVLRNKINPEFRGYTQYDSTTFTSTLVDLRPSLAHFFKSLFVLAALCLLAGTVCAYIFVHEFIEHFALKGVYLAAVSSLTAWVHHLLSKPLMVRSNFKFVDNENQFYCYTVIVFRFLNLNVPIYYAIGSLVHSQPDGVEQPMDYPRLWHLIVSVIATKIVLFWITRYAYRLLVFSMRRCLYFRSVKAAALRQAKTQKAAANQLSEAHHESQDRRGSHFIYKDIIPMISDELPQPKRQKKRCCCVTKLPDVFRRMALLNHDGIDADQLFADQIELQTLMPSLSEMDVLVDIVERYVLLSVAILYAGMCPFALVIVSIFFLVDIFAEFYVVLNCIERLPEFNNANGEIWNYFTQIIVFLAVITNLYVFNAFSNVYEQTLDKVFRYEKDSTLWVIVLTEHLLVVLVFAVQFFIPDIPEKVRRQRERQRSEIALTHGQMAATDPADEQKIKNLELQVAQLQSQLKAATAKQESKDNKALELVQYYQKDKSEIDLPEAKLAHFLKIDPRIHEYKQILDSVETALKVNFEIRLYRETFYLIERAVLQRKIDKITGHNMLVQISCVECCASLANVYCTDCMDHYCTECANQIHSAKHFKSHKTTKVQLDPTASLAKSLQGPGTTSPTKLDGGGGSTWRKFEYFNYPLDPMSDLYSQIQYHFAHLKKSYLDLNYIHELTGEMDMAAALVDQNYDSLTREEGLKLWREHEVRFGKTAIQVQKEGLDLVNFNAEELYYLNRVAFRLFKKHGAKVHFDKFHSDLNTLQYGDFDLRVKLWLKLIVEREEDVKMALAADVNLKVNVVSKQKFGNVVRASYPQDTSGRFKVNTLVDKVFGAETQMSTDELQAIIERDTDVRALVACVLQCEVASQYTAPNGTSIL